MDSTSSVSPLDVNLVVKFFVYQLIIDVLLDVTPYLFICFNYNVLLRFTPMHMDIIVWFLY